MLRTLRILRADFSCPAVSPCKSRPANDVHLACGRTTRGVYPYASLGSTVAYISRAGSLHSGSLVATLHPDSLELIEDLPRRAACHVGLGGETLHQRGKEARPAATGRGERRRPEGTDPYRRDSTRRTREGKNRPRSRPAATTSSPATLRAPAVAGVAPRSRFHLSRSPRRLNLAKTSTRRSPSSLLLSRLRSVVGDSTIP